VVMVVAGHGCLLAHRRAEARKVVMPSTKEFERLSSNRRVNLPSSG